MELLKKGRGGFQVDEAALPPGSTLEADASQGPAKPPSRLYQWLDRNGRLQISDQPPPKGAAGVKTYQGGSSD
jgi:hypothetical protein